MQLVLWCMQYLFLWSRGGVTFAVGGADILRISLCHSDVKLLNRVVWTQHFPSVFCVEKPMEFWFPISVLCPILSNKELLFCLSEALLTEFLAVPSIKSPKKWHIKMDKNKGGAMMKALWPGCLIMGYPFLNRDANCISCSVTFKS